MTTEGNTDTELTDDAFALAFSAAAGGKDFLAEPPPAEPPPAEPPPAEPPPAEPPPAEPPPAEPPPAEPPPAEPPPAPKKEPPKPDPVAEAAALKASEDAKAAAEKAAAEAATRESLTTDEQVTLAEVQTNFPEVLKFIQAVERTTIAKMENKFEQRLQAMQEQFNQQLAPVLSVTGRVARDAHEATILGSHADAFDILPKVEEWANAKPSFLKTSYNAVLDNGSAAEIVELLSIFKTETGSVVTPPAPKPEDAAQKAAREKKLQSQEGVRSRQAAQRGGIDENDFESAFKAAANA